jgi:hypothetical protein
MNRCDVDLNTAEFEVVSRRIGFIGIFLIGLFSKVDFGSKKLRIVCDLKTAETCFYNFFDFSGDDFTLM